MTTDLKQLHIAVGSVSEKLKKQNSSVCSSIDQLKEKAKTCAKDVHEQILMFAKTADRSPVCVIRNLIATSPLENLPRLHDLMVSWKIECPFDSPRTHSDLIAAMRVRSRSGDMFQWLILGGKSPSLGAVAPFFIGKLPELLAYNREATRDYNAGKSSDTLKLIKACFAKGFTDSMARYRDVFINDGFTKGLPKLDEADFKKLSSTAKRWILADKEFSRASLSSDLYASIWSNPFAFADTPEAIETKTWIDQTLPYACRHLRERNFTSCYVRLLLNRGDIGEYSTLILESLRNRKISHSWLRRDTVLDLPKGAGKLVDKRTANALNFFSKDIEQRLSVVCYLCPEEIGQLSIDVSSVDWLQAIRMSDSRAALNAIRERVFDDSSVRQKLFNDLSNAKTGRQFFTCFVQDLMQEADGAVLRRLVSKSAHAFSVWKPKFLSRPAFRDVLNTYCLTSAGAFDFIRHAPQRVLVKLFTSNEEWIREWRYSLASQAGRSQSRALRREVRYLLAKYCPGIIGETIGWKISYPDFERLCSEVLSVNRGKGCGVIFDFIEPGGKACWERLYGKTKYARLLRPMIRRERPDIIPRINMLDAAKLWGNPKFRAKLTGILEGTETEAPLGVSHPVLREMIPWVRKAWSKKPTLAVAFELALAFSLRDSRYLISLCAARWKSGDKDRGGHAFDHLYRTHSLPKKSGGSRLITVPDASLKRLQRRILRNGFDQVFIHPSAHGFKSGCSILTNATPHVGKACVVNVDIESFFPSTRYPLILRACSLLVDGKLSEGACHVVADICSFGGGLPTGAPTSPAIANLVLRSADAAITKAATANGITYTRYADDLTFSGDTNAVKILPFVKRVLAQLGYQLKEKKTNIFRRGRRQMVTGLVVNDKPNLPRHIRRRLRAAVHQMTKDGNPQWQGHPMSSHELLGRIAFLNLVQPEEAQALKFKMKGPK